METVYCLTASVSLGMRQVLVGSDYYPKLLPSQQFRQRIVGFKQRTHMSSYDGTYYYDKNPAGLDPGYSIMIGATLILHKVYFEMYNDPRVLPRSLFEYIDEIMNCDDLAMSVMVTKFLREVSWPQCGVLAIVPEVKIQNLQGEGECSFASIYFVKLMALHLLA